MASVLAELPSNSFRDAESRAGNKENVPIGWLASSSKVSAPGMPSACWYYNAGDDPVLKLMIKHCASQDKCPGTRKRTATRSVVFISSSQVHDPGRLIPLTLLPGFIISCLCAMWSANVISPWLNRCLIT